MFEMAKGETEDEMVKRLTMGLYGQDYESRIGRVVVSRRESWGERLSENCYECEWREMDAVRMYDVSGWC
jgi:hypothetical protein